MALFPGLPRWAGTRKVKPIWILLKQETVSGSGFSWAIYKSAPCCRQITMPPDHSVFFTDRMPFLPPNQQHQITDRNWSWKLFVRLDWIFMSKHGHYWLLFVGNNCSCNLVLKMNSGEIILRQHIIEAQCHFCICDIGPFTLGMKAQLLYSDFLMRDGEKKHH